MARQTYEQDPWGWSGQTPGNTDTVPRWLVLAGAIGGLGVALLLLRYAIDLLGLVFIIVLVGFSIRTLTDWLSDSETVSPGTLAWLSVGLFGTAMVALWLFGSPARRAARVERHLPGFMVRGIEWAEDRGWGRRMLLTVPEDGEEPRRDGGALLRPRGARIGDPQPYPGTAGARTPGAAKPAAPAPDTGPAPPLQLGAGDSRPTRTTLTVAPLRAAAGARVRLDAAVQCADGTRPAGGTVIFWSGTMVLGSAPLRREGAEDVAAFVTADLPPGVHELSAQYAGSAQCRTSRSPAVEQLTEP